VSLRGRWTTGLALASVCLALGLTMLDATVVSVILPDLRQSLQVGITGLQWVVASYALVFAALMLTGGTLGDRYGRRRLLLGGIAGFVAGSLVSATAVSTGMLYAGRVVQGLGAAACEPGTLSILRQLYPERATRARAIGLWAGVSGLALALGPVIGGVLVQVGGWRSVFWFNVVLGSVAFVSCAALVPESVDRAGRRLDLAGQALGAVALALLTLALIGGQDYGFGSATTLGLFAGAGLSAVVFAVTEHRVADPVLPLRFFADRAFTAANLLAFAANFGIFAIFLFLSLYLQLDQSVSAASTAARFVPMSAGMIVAAPLAGRWVARAGPRGALAAGVAAAAAGMLLVRAILTGGAVGLSLSLALLGLGLGTILPPVTAIAVGRVPRQASGMAAGTANTSRQVGAVVGVTVLGAIIDRQLTTSLVARLTQLHVPAAFRRVAVREVTAGRLDLPLSLLRRRDAHHLLDVAFQVGRHSFETGMRVALLTSALVLIGAGALAFLAIPGGADETPGPQTSARESGNHPGAGQRGDGLPR
jgi:EmrB/QacA subfamily drug resistance transporter